MKHLQKFFFFTFVCVTACCCNKEINKQEDVKVTTYSPSEIGVTSAKCGGDVIINVQGLPLSELGICWSESENPSIKDEKLSTTNFNDCFVCEIKGLKPDTKYYVRAYVLRGTQPYYGEEKSFKTAKFSGVSILLNPVENVSFSSVTCSATIQDDGGVSIDKKGFCWSSEKSPSIEKDHVFVQNEGVEFSYRLSPLMPSTQYFLRAFITNQIGTFYSNELSFETLDGCPVLSPVEVSNVSSSSVTAKSAIIEQGSANVSKCGFCWGIDENPTIDNDHLFCNSWSSGLYGEVRDLLPGTKYYIRSFAQNSVGIAYSDQSEFFTGVSQPTVITQTASDIGRTNAKLVGYIANDGGKAIQEQGFQWGITNQFENTVKSESFSQSYSVILDNLVPRTKYYFRAYAINEKGIGYGSVETLSTYDIPCVSSTSISNVSAISLTASSSIVDDGGSQITESGFCWAVSSLPSITNSHVVVGTTIGNISYTIEGLQKNTRYYVRAYAINKYGISYGEESSCLTDDGIAQVSISGFDNILADSANCSSVINDNGGASIIHCGVCWSNSENPTIANNKNFGTISGNSFDCKLIDLKPNVKYYVRAFVENSFGVYYSSQAQFTTKDGIAQISTCDISSIESTSAISGGIITTDGGSNISQKGVCWGTSPNPTINDAHTSEGAGAMAFTSNLTNLKKGSVYYVRAYVKNSYGIYYGDEKSFMAHPIGSIAGIFSVSTNKKVYISQGNLQYQNTQWKFADNQYDYMGTNNETGKGWIDVFSYGNCGYNGMNPYYAYQYAECCIENTYYDWGLYCKIINGGNQQRMWRTLTQAEWRFLLSERQNASEKSSSATVNDVPGLIILPDNWNLPNGITFTPRASNYWTNSYSANQWRIMEDNGAVFLPASGYNYSTNRMAKMYNVGVHGYYYSTAFRSTPSPYANYLSVIVIVNADGFSMEEMSFYHVGYNGQSYSVRLVQDE